MRIDVPYGRTFATADLDWARVLDVLDIADVPEQPDRDEAIRHAIEHPIGCEKNLFEIVRPGETAAILVSDMFRETRADQVLPVLLNGLNQAGIPDDAIRIVFATGTHRPPTAEEQIRILGAEILRRCEARIHVHNPYDEANLVYLGTTSRGTPVDVNRRVYEADRIIATGVVVFHYFGGYGGGRKSIVPGIASVKTIAHNHAMNLDPHEDRINPAVRIGALDGNPVSEDMLEGARFLHVDYIVNTVLNRHARIAAVFAGEMDAAHRAATQYARSLFSVSIREKADLVIASAGPAKNFVQSHKALYNAYQAVKPTGRIVFLTQCLEGLGGKRFVKWLRLGNRGAIITGLRQRAEINGQTALSTLEKAPLALFVTEMPDPDVRLLGARKAGSLQQALALAKHDLAHIANPTCYLMPSASYTVPILEAI